MNADSRVRVIDLETTGSRPPAHDVCEIGWQDVVQDDAGRWSVNEERGVLLVNPGRPIPPVTMAVHHIIDADVADAPFWKDVAPSVLRPEGGAVALAAHRASFEQRFCTPQLSGGARWICTWKCALRLWPDSPSFSNQVLRYWRMPEGLDRETGLPVHRAMPDAYVTAHHLRDMLNETSLEQLLAWSDDPGLLPRVPTGPERGRYWAELEVEMLRRFAADRDEDIRFSADTELRRRAGDDRIVPLGADRSPPRLLSRRRMGRAGARSPSALGEADAGRLPGRTRLDHDPSKARRIPGRVRRLRSEKGRRVRREGFRAPPSGAGIVRSRSKIEAVIGNARAYIAMQDAGEDFSDFCWSFVDGEPIVGDGEKMLTRSPQSEALSAAFKKRGFKFVGPAIVYAWMQACGLVDDHEGKCFRREASR